MSFSTFIFTFYKMLFKNNLGFSCFADFFCKAYKNQRGLPTAWSKRLESFVKMMSKNFISGVVESKADLGRISSKILDVADHPIESVILVCTQSKLYKLYISKFIIA